MGRSLHGVGNGSAALKLLQAGDVPSSYIDQMVLVHAPGRRRCSLPLLATAQKLNESLTWTRTVDLISCLTF